MPDQQFQLWVKRQNLPQLGNRLRRSDAMPKIPGPLDRTVEQFVGTVGTPVELARDQIDRGAGQWRGQRLTRGIAETKGAGIRIGIEASDRGVITSGHPAVAAVELAAKLANGKPPG